MNNSSNALPLKRLKYDIEQLKEIPYTVITDK